MFTQRSSAWSWWPAFILILLLGGCGGSSDTSQSLQPQDGVGKVALLFTDLPSDDFDHIWISFDEVTLLGADGQQQVYGHLAEDTGMTIDLLDLETVMDLAFIREVPAGFYSKVRLHLTGIHLVMGEVDTPVDLVANGKLDLNPQGSFEVRAGQLLFIQLDIDANRSFQLHEGGNGTWHFRPVVFMDIYGDFDSQRLMRVFGDVVAVDNADAPPTFDLCPTGMISHYGSSMGMGMMVSPDHSHCIQAFVNQSGVFGGIDGTDQGAGALQVSDPLTMIGFFRPSAGMPADALSQFDTVVIELGDEAAFERRDGFAVNAPDETGLFDWDSAGDVTSTQLQAKTRVFDSHGTEYLNGVGIVPDATGTVDGIETVGGVFNASLVLLDAMAAAELSGAVATIDAPNNAFNLITSPEAVAVDVCVAVDARILKLEVVSGVDTLSAAVFGDIAPDQSVEVAGAQGDTCFEASLVIIDLTAP
ncbi:MAG: DUF4382 domain-containing protein [Gammaproteobacteria bacterium]|nr:DUF4382 domain-containing protein [Gammaproteobacteria bacterium]